MRLNLKGGSIGGFGGGILTGVENGASVKDEYEDGRPAAQDARGFGRSAGRHEGGVRIGSQLTRAKLTRQFRRDAGQQMIWTVIVAAVVAAVVGIEVVAIAELLVEKGIHVVVGTRAK